MSSSVDREILAALEELEAHLDDHDRADSDPPAPYESKRGRDVAAARASCSAIADASIALSRR